MKLVETGTQTATLTATSCVRNAKVNAIKDLLVQKVSHSHHYTTLTHH